MWWLRVERDISARVSPEEWGVPTLHQVPHPKVPVPEKEVSITSVKTSKDHSGVRWRASWVSGVPLEGPCMNLHSFSLTSSTRKAAWKATGIYEGKLNCLISGPELEGKLSHRQNCWQRILFFFWDFPNRVGRRVPYLSLHQPGSQFAPHWLFRDFFP